ncbi:MAG: alpha-amylase family glycosyl hydrolase [Bacteroidales bacterium]|nr:alpha-amylase family glycosyl hydrolase [Bacteroidales bacterium]
MAIAMDEKIIIYQTLPRLSGNRVENPVPGYSFDVNGTGKFIDYTERELANIKNLGCTHIWFTGVLEHATQSKCLNNFCLPDSSEIVKGVAGSPYAVKDYYDVAHYLAVNHQNRVEEFEDLINRSHKAGLKVIMDFVPNHLSRNYHSDKNPGEFSDFGHDDDNSLSFSPNNDFYYIPNTQFISPCCSESSSFKEFPAKATGNDCFRENPSYNDWYETVKLNYGVDYSADNLTHFNPRPKLWDKMLHILNYWSEKGIDGFRCDMAEMVPTEFWSYVTKELRISYPNLLFIAEVYNPNLYKKYLESGFNLLYDKVGLYDTLINILKGAAKPSDISLSWQQLGNIQSCMLNFIENHDEQRVASDFIARSGHKAIPAFVVSLLFNRASFMLYFAQELGEKGMDQEGFSGIDGRTSIFDFWSLKTIINYNKGLYDLDLKQKYKFLLNLANEEPAIRYGETYDLQYANIGFNNYDSSSIFSFARFDSEVIILVIVNFSDRQNDVSLNIPEHLFSHWNISDNSLCNSIDLSNDIKGKHLLSSKIPLNFRLRENSFLILKLLLQ